MCVTEEGVLLFFDRLSWAVKKSESQEFSCLMEKYTRNPYFKLDNTAQMSHIEDLQWSALKWDADQNC